MKKELFALAQKNRSKIKYKTTRPALQKDFITANTVIKDKTITSNEDKFNKGNMSPLVNTGKEIVIKNTNVEDKYKLYNNSNNNNNNNQNKDNKSTTSSIVLSGSNYNKMIPEVGVVVKQDNQSKNGGLNFHNQFGKMSVKEYEQLRAMYMNNHSNSSNNINHYSSNISPQYNNNNNNNHVIVRDDVSDVYANNNNNNHNSNSNHHYQGSSNSNNNNSYTAKYLYKRSRTDDTMVNSGNIVHYNWNDQPYSYNNMNINSSINSTNTYSTQNGILNEDLFKGRKIHQMKTNTKRSSIPQQMYNYNYSLPINFNYYNNNNNNNTNTYNNNTNNMTSSIPLRKLSPSNNRSRRKF